MNDYVIWKVGSKYQTTTKENYNSNIINGNKIIDIETNNDDDAVKAVKMWITRGNVELI